MTIAELVYKITGDNAQLKKAVDNSGKDVKGLGKIMAAAGKVITGVFAVSAVKAIVTFSKKLVGVYAVQEKAENALQAAINATGKEATISLDSMKTYASSLQAVTVFGDEAILSGQALLQSLADLNEKGLQEVSPAVLDFAQATGTDLKTAFNLVGKSIGSSTNALARYGIEIDTSASKQDKLAQITEELESKFGGIAEAAGETTTGDITQLSNTMGDLQETFGRVISKGINPFVRALDGMFSAINENITATADLQDSLDQLNEYGKVVGDLSRLESDLAAARAKLLEPGNLFNIQLLDLISATEKAITAEQERLKWQAFEDKVLSDLEEKAKAAAEAEATRTAELAAYLELVNTEYLKTSEGQIEALENEIAMWEEYALTAVSTSEEVEAILAVKKAALLDLVDSEEEQLDRSGELWLENNAEISRQEEELTRLMDEESKKRIQGEIDAAAETKRIRQDAVAGTIALFGQLEATSALYYETELSQQEKGSEEYKRIQLEQWEADQKFAKTRAVISGAEAAIGAYSAMAKIPVIGPALGIAAAAAAVGFALKQVSLIEQQSPPAFANGGIVPQPPGVAPTGDNVLARLNPGEVILNAAQQANLAGGIGGSTIIINNMLSMGKESEIRATARKLLPFLDEERARRG